MPFWINLIRFSFFDDYSSIISIISRLFSFLFSSVLGFGFCILPLFLLGLELGLWRAVDACVGPSFKFKGIV